MRIAYLRRRSGSDQRLNIVKEYRESQSRTVTQKQNRHEFPDNETVLLTRNGQVCDTIFR